jgi:hypothetical protein
MTVYHGSVVCVEAPLLAYSRHKLDFGRGFYITTMQTQAEKWAIRKSFVSDRPPIVSVYQFDTNGLDILTFNGYTLAWLDFVTRCRTEEYMNHSYDGIFGNIADDDVATLINDYLRLLRAGRITPAAKQFYLEQLQYSKPNDQYCIATQKGINALSFETCYNPEG